MFSVNAVLTVGQLTCGAIANSLSLLGDGALMAMDGVSYAVSIYAERRKLNATEDAIVAERADRLGALFNVVMLAATTCWVLFDVVDRLVGDDEQEDGDDTKEEVEVDGGVMVGFTVVNLVADAAVVLACWWFGVASVVSDADEAGANMNLFGALAHLAADCVRGVAVLFCGILAIAGLVDATKADAYCSLFVCIFVLAAAVSLLRVVIRKSNPLAYDEVDEPTVATPKPTSQEHIQYWEYSASPKATTSLNAATIGVSNEAATTLAVDAVSIPLARAKERRMLAGRFPFRADHLPRRLEQQDELPPMPRRLERKVESLAMEHEH